MSYIICIILFYLTFKNSNSKFKNMTSRNLILSLILISIPLISSSYPLCSPSSSTSCLPCPSPCNLCSSSTTCSSCTSQYYFQSSTCSSCPQNCQTCTSSACSVCNDPYVLATSGTCLLCAVGNAKTCSGVSVATSCDDLYYVSDGNCRSCMLNCKVCSSASDCTQCSSGYYLNSTIKTCNPCPTGCSTCDQFTPTTCNTCNDGYELQSTSCISVTCNITNCKYCQTSSLCKQCNQFYYTNGTNCLQGSSPTCTSSSGLLPTHCVNSCSQYTRQQYATSDTSSSTFMCKIYRDVYVSSVQYHQIYYYAYNDAIGLSAMISGGGSTVAVGDQVAVAVGAMMDLGTVPNYYKAVVYLKYTSSSDLLLTFQSTTPLNTTQQQSLTLPPSTTPTTTSLSLSTLHSNSIQLTPNNTLNLIQLYIRLSKCDQSCIICLNQELCQYCVQPSYVLSYKCVTSCGSYYHLDSTRSCVNSCPDLFYADGNVSNSKFCRSCVSPCEKCSNTSFCLSCVDGYFYYNYTCLTTCPSGYFQSNSTNNCQKCISPCQQCSSLSTCLSCSQGFWDGSQCSNSCPSGTYGQTSNNTCSSCDANCVTCSLSASSCLSCNSSLILHSKECVSNCPDRYYLNNLTCSDCVPPCYTCSSQSTCISCSFNYLMNGSCLSSCQDGYYKDQANLICETCSSHCATCSSATQCLSCNSGCLHLGQCLSSCPSLYFTTNSSSCSCTPCTYPCNTCQNTSYCDSCIEGFLVSGSCLTTCPTGYYGNDTDNTCGDCVVQFNNCSQCTIDGCTLCASGLVLFNGSCSSSCPSQYYVQNLKCLSCVAPCETCTALSVCLSCVSPYILFNTSCVIQCQTSQAAITINSTLQCVDCQSPCLSCSITTTNCTYCTFGNYLHNNICYTNCSSITPLNTLYNEISTLSCSSCNFPCNECSSQDQCLSCRTGYLNNSTLKCQECAIGTYASGGLCNTCPVSCAVCYSDSYCTSCNDGYFLYLNQCINDSSVCLANGYYAVGKICYVCSQPCQKCLGSSLNCTTCMSGYIYHDPNSCLIQCPTQYYRSNDSCLQCDSMCSSCISSSDYCLSCNTPYLLQISTASCLSACPSQSYQSGSLCTACSYPCQTCTSQTSCLSCVSGVLIADKCYSSCSSGYFANSSLMCEQCTSPCQECDAATTNCTQCIDNNYLLNNTCVTTCPTAYFAETQSSQCLACANLCQQCTSYINCTSCTASYIYFQNPTLSLGECLLSCPSAYYLVNASTISCESCLTECSTCGDNSSCLLCNSGKIQYNGGCVTECPEGMYGNSGVCNNCSYPCLNCSGASTCTACSNSSYLLVASASCVPGPDCPEGYYLLDGEAKCDSSCPTGYYHLNNRTCNNLGCASNEFMGADMKCYSTCPSNYIANTSLHCIICPTCSVLNYDLSSQIIKDSLYLYLIFTQTPLYKTAPTITFSPALPYTLQTSDVTVASSYSPQFVGATTTSGKTNLTMQITVTESISETYLTVNFDNSIDTFSNPLQKASQTIYLEGFDVYPNEEVMSFTIFAVLGLFCALMGLVKSPYMTDYAQVLFLIALLNYHYPIHLAEFLESSDIALIHNLMLTVQQPDSLGKGKFLYVADIGFLSNTMTNLLLIGLGLLLALVGYLVMVILKRSLIYDKVDKQDHHTQQDQNIQQGQNIKQEQNVQQDSNIKQEQKVKQDSQQQSKKQTQKLQTKINLLNNLEMFYTTSAFKIQYLNRLVYFNFNILCLFSMTQLVNFSTSSGINTISGVLSLITIIILAIFPFLMKNDKPKYTFLYARKLLICGAVVLSQKNAIYAVGIISVCNLTAAILIISFRVQKYRKQTLFLLSGQLIQFFIMVCLSYFIMIGEGNRTSQKVTLAYMIVFTMIGLLCLYILYAIVDFVIFLVLKCKGIDLKENWRRNDQEDQSEDGEDSESNDKSMKGSKKSQKDKQGNKEENLKRSQRGSQNLQTYLIKIKQQMKDLNSEQISPQKGKPKRSDELFWHYNESQNASEQNQQKPPQRLIRCINQFSDYNSEKQE